MKKKEKEKKNAKLIILNEKLYSMPCITLQNRLCFFFVVARDIENEFIFVEINREEK